MFYHGSDTLFPPDVRASNSVDVSGRRGAKVFASPDFRYACAYATFPTRLATHYTLDSGNGIPGILVLVHDLDKLLAEKAGNEEGYIYGLGSENFTQVRLPDRSVNTYELTSESAAHFNPEHVWKINNSPFTAMSCGVQVITPRDSYTDLSSSFIHAHQALGTPEATGAHLNAVNTAINNGRLRWLNKEFQLNPLQFLM